MCLYIIGKHWGSFLSHCTPLGIRYDYTRHGRQLSWDWHNPVTGAPDPRLEWSHHAGRNQVLDSTFKEFL